MSSRYRSSAALISLNQAAGTVPAPMVLRKSSPANSKGRSFKGSPSGVF